MSRTRSVYWDPDGTRYGIATYPWQCAPAGLATRRQLAAKGLRPGGQPVAAQVLWHSPSRPSGYDAAYLYRLDLAKPKRAATPGQLAALGKALAARRTCPKCGTDAGYVIPARRGMCNRCADAEYFAPPTCREYVGYVISSYDDDQCADPLDRPLLDNPATGGNS